MKVIDLLNKIAKGEEVPKKITTNRKNFYLVKKNTVDNDYDYEDENGQYFISYLNEYYYTTDYLNMEIEIIEEEKEIEEITLKLLNREHTESRHIIDMNENIERTVNKINELVRELNKIKKEIKK